VIVVDASVVVAFLIDPARLGQARAAFRAADDDLHAPAHIDLEVASALRRHVDAGILPAPRADAAMTDLGDLPLVRHPVEALMPRVWALRTHVSPYDAAYLALAEGLGAPLLTLDPRLARTSGHGVDVRVLDGVRCPAGV
jgi:predicted nucleic acid-binding protein